MKQASLAETEEEQFRCFAAQCPICGDHCVELVKFPVVSQKDEIYWKL